MKRARGALCLVLPLFWLAGCSAKHHPQEADTSWIETLAVVVAQDSGQPLSLTLVESEVTRHLYQRFRLITRSQLETIADEHRLAGGRLFDPPTLIEIGQLAGVEAVLQVTVTGHEIEWTTTQRYRAHVSLAMQLFEVATGTVCWSCLSRRTKTSETISVAVHDSVSGAVWDCVKRLTGWESMVEGDGAMRVCSRTGLQLAPASDADGRRVTVQEVAAGSVWAEAGLRAGDVIEAVNGRQVSGSAIEFPRGAEERCISLSIRRGDRRMELTVPIAPEEALSSSGSGHR